MHKNPHPKIEIKNNSINSTKIGREKTKLLVKLVGKQGMMMNSLFREFTHHGREVIILFLQ